MPEPRQDFRETLDLCRERTSGGCFDAKQFDERLAVRRRHIDAFGNEIAANRQGERLARADDHANVRLLTRMPVAEQQLIAADTLELRIGVRRDDEAALRKPPGKLAAPGGLNHDLAAILLPVCFAHRTAVVAVERDMIADEQAHRRT